MTSGWANKLRKDEMMYPIPEIKKAFRDAVDDAYKEKRSGNRKKYHASLIHVLSFTLLMSIAVASWGWSPMFDSAMYIVGSVTTALFIANVIKKAYEGDK